MSLDPKIAQILLSEVPEMKAFRVFLAEEANKLNTLTGLDKLDFKERSYEITARLRAFEVLMTILAPLINNIPTAPQVDGNDYMV